MPELMKLSDRELDVRCAELRGWIWLVRDVVRQGQGDAELVWPGLVKLCLDLHSHREMRPGEDRRIGSHSFDSVRREWV